MRKVLFILAMACFVFISFNFASACDDPPCVQVNEEPELDIETYAMSDRSLETSSDIFNNGIGVHSANIDGKGTENFDVEGEVNIYTIDAEEKSLDLNGAKIGIFNLDKQLTYVKTGTNEECKNVLLNVENNRNDSSEIVGCIETKTNSHQDVKVDYTGPEDKLEFYIFNQSDYGYVIEKEDGDKNQVYYRGLIRGSKTD